MFSTQKLKKGDHYLKAGRHTDELDFVQDGLLREYLMIDGKEVTKWVSSAGYFSVDLYSFVFSEPARWNIEALLKGFISCRQYIYLDHRGSEDYIHYSYD